MKRSTKGFTLIELMIAVAVIGILIAIAVPAYRDQTMKSRRADAITALEKAAARQEQYYFQHNAYTTTESNLGGAATYITSPEGYYRVVVTQPNGSDQEYTLTATPVSGGPQASDAKCTTFTLDHLGVKGGTPTANASMCWNR